MKYWSKSIQKRQEGVLAAWKRIEQYSSVLTRDKKDCMIEQDSSVLTQDEQNWNRDF